MASKYGIEFKYKDKSGYDNKWFASQDERDRVYKSWTPKKLLASNVVSIKEIQS